MGLIHRGIPAEYALSIAKEQGLEYFVETGTHIGRTAVWAAKHFEYVLTIEYDKSRCRENRAKYGHIRNINFLMGDSRILLKSTLLAMPGPAMIWLDAHWSRDLGYTRPEAGECPIMEEIAAIKQVQREHVILIDDARFFVGRPPKPHKENQWPTYKEIADALHPLWTINHLKTLDILVAFPVL
jgi:hypothetical protein